MPIVIVNPMNETPQTVVGGTPPAGQCLRMDGL